MPLRLFASGTRTTANVARGLMYAGMYGMFFFVGQFLQDVQGYSPLRTGLCFLPMPASVFLSSQLVSRVLVGRVRPKALIMSGIGIDHRRSALGEPAPRRRVVRRRSCQPRADGTGLGDRDGAPDHGRSGGGRAR